MIKIVGMGRTRATINNALKGMGSKVELALSIILQAVSANTKPYVPVDTSALINSETRKVTTSGKFYVGEIAYGDSSAVGANGTPVSKYAGYVHDGPQKNWQKSGASNKYLSKGVRDFIRDDLDDILNGLADDVTGE